MFIQPHREVGDASKNACELGGRPSGGQSWTDFQVGDYRDRRRASLLYVSVPRKKCGRDSGATGTSSVEHGTAEAYNERNAGRVSARTGAPEHVSWGNSRRPAK